MVYEIQEVELLSLHGAESESKWLNVDLRLGPRLD